MFRLSSCCGLGARGVDWIEKATVEDTSISFPIYDGHGNVIAQLGRTGSSYSLTQVKKYDVWGGVRSGALGPAGRYCGNLGHVSDDESGLIYMRVRYCEPGSGRFVSEDPAFDGQNWYAYCGNDPVGNVDPSGCNYDSLSNAFRSALAQGALGNWQDLVDLIDIIATACGAPIDGRAAQILDVLQSVPTPKRGLRNVVRWSRRNVEGLTKSVVEHIVKALTCHERELKHHLDDMWNWVNDIYRRVRN